MMESFMKILYHLLKLVCKVMCLVISSGITDDDLRESAYEILLAAAGASGYLFFLFCLWLFA